MNTTATNNPSFNYETSTYVMIGLLVISEILPFIKKTKGSGFIHSLLCLLRGSECQAKKITDDAKKKLDLDIEKKKQKFNEDMEKELIDVEKEIINLKKSSLLNINKIAEEISSNLIKQIMGVEINASKVSATVKDISNKRSEKYL